MCEIIPKLCEYDECILFALQLFAGDVVVVFLGIRVRFIAFVAHIYAACFYRSPGPRVEKESFDRLFMFRLFSISKERAAHGAAARLARWTHALRAIDFATVDRCARMKSK